jgi:hypothetical protein
MIKILNSWPDWLIILLFSIACLIAMYSLHAILRPILNKLIPGEERENYQSVFTAPWCRLWRQSSRFQWFKP